MRSFKLLVASTAGAIGLLGGLASADNVSIPCNRITFKFSSYTGAELRNVFAYATTGNASSSQLLIDGAGKTIKDFVDVCALSPVPNLPVTIELYTNGTTSPLFDFIITTAVTGNVDISVALQAPK